MQINGSRVLVTGASRGLGPVIARELHRRGARLVLTARDGEALSALAAEVGGEVVVADLAARDDVTRLTAVASDCDAVVLNAGVGEDPTLAALDEPAIDRFLEVNLRAPIVLATGFANAKVAAGRPGAIALVGSLAGMAASPGTRMYNATKFGLRGFALGFAEELHGTGVTASLVAPGFIRDAGMFHDGGTTLPPGVRTRTPHDVALGVATALTDAPIEVFVAPTELRLLSTFASVAPGISARVQRRLDVAGRKERGRAGR